MRSHTSPAWRAEDLGAPLPDDPHAVSVALPRWADVVAYEEGDPACLDRLHSGYPRFVMVPLVQQLRERIAREANHHVTGVWPLCNATVAKQAKAFCDRTAPGSTIYQTTLHGIDLAALLAANRHASLQPNSFGNMLGWGCRHASPRLLWAPHSVNSSDSATNTVDANTADNASAAHSEVRKRLAEIYGVSDDLVSVHPSGMAALYTALAGLNRFRPGKPVLQLNFPYVDDRSNSHRYCGMAPNC